MQLVSNWIEILRTCNLSRDRGMDRVSRWLLITRACVFSMTHLSMAIGALLAGLSGHTDWPVLAAVFVGLTLAHASNNMVNDYFDLAQGVDTENYPRTQYAPHPLLDNLVSKGGLFWAIVVCNVIELAIAFWITYLKGWPIMYFAVIGLALSVFYVAPPLKLKHNGLGEVAIFLIWGPLITGGTYYAIAQTLPAMVLWATVPYGLAVMAVVVGKHLDKRDKDLERKVYTLPVILGDRYGRWFMGFLILAFYASVVLLAVLEMLPWFSLLACLTLPQAVRVFYILTRPMPESPQAAFKLAAKQIPKDLREKFDPNKPGNESPLWPLWYVVWGVWWVRYAGFFFVVGLAVSLVELYLL
jgi:1,4-dihydroxy-2-naphthoate octaprenyltransferase